MSNMLLFDDERYSHFLNPLSSRNRKVYYECIQQLIEKSRNVPLLYETDARDTLILYFRNCNYALVEEEGNDPIGNNLSETDNAGAVLRYFRYCGWLSERELGRNGDNIATVDPYCRKLTNAINRIIEDMNHSFVEKVIIRDFVSHDLGVSQRNLRNERDISKRTDALDNIDKHSVTEKLMQILNIRNKEKQTLTVTDSQAIQIKGYLKALDLIVECPVVYSAGTNKEQRVLFTQPGMRYCQAQALVYSLMQDEFFSQLSSKERKYVIDRILSEIRGRMLEDIVLLETMKAFPDRYEVFKFQFISGEFDMVIYDKQTDSCAAYVIKHSSQYIQEQARHLMDDEKLSLLSPRFGTLNGRYVLYLGEDMNAEEGIVYRNVEQYLKNLPQISLASEL